MKKKLYYIVGILVFVMTIFSLLGYSNTLEANKRVSEFNKDGAYQMQNFSNQENLLIKNLSTIKNGYINHWLQHCGQTSYNGYRNRHLFCAHWYNGSGRKEEKYEILDVLDIGYYGGNGNVELKSPTYIYSYASNKEIYDTSTVSVFLAQQAYRSTVELSVEIDDVMPNVIKNLKPVLSSDVIKKLESATYSGSSSMGLDFTNTRANVWAIHNERAYPTGKYYDPTIYNVTKNIGEFSEMKTLDSQGNYTEASATINLESENRVGPFYLKIPHGAKVTVNTDIPYEIEGGAIVSEKGFYINFADSVPDEISFSCTYEQYYGRIFIAYGGLSQDVWISKGKKDFHSSTVEYKIIKGSDLSANTYIQYSRYRNETPILNSTEPSQENHLIRKSYTEEQKQENPFYAEQGDILKVGIDVKNNTNSNATVGKINSNYEDILSLSTQEELEEKWKTDLTEQLNNSAWIEIDELNSYATTYYNNTEYAELSQKILSKNNTITENLMLTVNANPKEHTEQYEINGNILLEDITPEDLDESNNSSSDYMKIKSIDAEIKKEILEGSSDGARAEDGKYMVEYGDIIEYMITVSNPVQDGKDEKSVSTLYNTKFVESIPEGLEIQDVKRFTSNGWESVLNSSQIEIVDNKFEVTINDNYGISPNNAAAYIFKYKVISYGADSNDVEEPYEKITNTANLVEYYNRNNYQYIDTDSSSEEIYVRSYDLGINKFLYTFSDVNSPISSGISACEGRELLSEEEKAYNPMYVEYGDRIVYQIDVTNEGDCTFTNIKIDDIFDNQELQLDINLDNYVLVKEVENDNIIKEISSDKSQIRYTILELKPGEKETIRIVFNVIKTLDPDDEESNSQIINTAKIISATNHNNIEIIDKENTLIGQIESSEHCIEKLYNVETNKYISGYTSEMMNENIENGLINQEEEAALYYDGNLEEFEFNRENLSNEEKEIKPFAAEKSDKVTFTIKVENKANENEESNSTIIIGTILDYLDSGLELIDESFRGTLNQNNEIKTLENNVDFSAGGIDKYTDTIAITFPEKIVLKPGEYIEFNYDVEITASNMMVELLKNEVILTEIVNRNGLVIVEQMGQGTPNVDTGLNPPPIISREYVELKDLVVSGYIWDDKNENGLKDEEEPGIPNVEVELNGLTEESKANVHTKVITNEDGLYTFGRVFKTNQNEEYEKGLYITYQYNGAEYQNTVYSGKTNLVYENNAYRMKPNFYIDSNAKEIDEERIEFNNSLKTIYYDGASKEFELTSEDITLKYNKEDSISTNTNNYSDENGALIKAYSFLNSQENNEVIECL